MSRLPAAVAAIGLLAALTACEEDAPSAPPAPPRSGTVTYLEHEEAASGVELDCGWDYDYTGHYGYGCDPVFWSDPECFWVEFEDTAGAVWEECAASEAVFDSLAVGDPYTEGQLVPGEVEPTG